MQDIFPPSPGSSRSRSGLATTNLINTKIEKPQIQFRHRDLQITAFTMTAASSTTDVETAPEIIEKDVKDVKDVDETPKEIEYPPLAKVLVIILALYLAVFLVALDQTIIGTAIPRITDQFKSISDIAW